MIETIEKKVGEAILQDSITIRVGNVEFEVAQPTVATVIEASKHISNIPKLNIKKDADIISNVLANAVDSECLGDIAAILILGKGNLFTEKKMFFGLIKKRVSNQKRLAEKLLQLNPKLLHDLIVEILKSMNVGFFLSVITFLNEVNLLRATKTIPSGQPSPE